MLWDVRILIFSAFFLSVAITVGTPMMLLLAFTAGFLWDCQHTLGPHMGSDLIYTEKVESIRFGQSIILYGLMGGTILSFQPLFREGKWKTPTIIGSITLYIYLWVEYLIINIVRGEFAVNYAIFYKISFTSLLSTLLIPPFFLALIKLAKFYNYSLQNDGRRSYFSSENTLNH